MSMLLLLSPGQGHSHDQCVMVVGVWGVSTKAPVFWSEDQKGDPNKEKVPRRMQRRRGSGPGNIVYKFQSLPPSLACGDLVINSIPKTLRTVQKERADPRLPTGWCA